MSNLQLEGSSVGVLNSRFLCYKNVNSENQMSASLTNGIKAAAQPMYIYDFETKNVTPQNFLHISKLNKNNFGVCELFNGKKAFVKINTQTNPLKIEVYETNFSRISSLTSDGFCFAETKDEAGDIKSQLLQFNGTQYQVLLTLPKGCQGESIEGNTFIVRNLNKTQSFGVIENLLQKQQANNLEQDKASNLTSLASQETTCCLKALLDTSQYKEVTMFKNGLATCQFHDGLYGFLELRENNRIFVYGQRFNKVFEPVNDVSRVITADNKYCYVFLDGCDATVVSGKYDFCEDLTVDGIGVARVNDGEAGYTHSFQKWDGMNLCALKATVYRKNRGSQEGRQIKTASFKKCNSFVGGFGSIVNDDESSLSFVSEQDGKLLINPLRFLHCGEAENGVINIVDMSGKNDYVMVNDGEFGENAGSFVRLNLDVSCANPIKNGIGIIHKFGKQHYIKICDKKLVARSEAFDVCKPFEQGFGLCRKNGKWMVVDENLNILQIENFLEEIKSSENNKPSVARKKAAHAFAPSQQTLINPLLEM